ncbi:amino acid ABC transporter permease [Nocardioides insulae]|uniref:amino acid ABC transporter permease n=1 Tax=Nocardioides insulae TaxID=394734 RepID=UPI000419FEF4|nr:amino acid ABC transporter permease [Nocardioides insulae]
MPASVLFDAPGPKTRARHRLYTVLAVLVLVALAAIVLWRLYDADQFAYEKWEPFLTPFYIQAIGEAWWQTLSMAGLAVLGALVIGFVFGVGKLSDRAWVRWPCWLFVEFFRALPVIMLMVFCFYTVFGDLPISAAAYWAAVLALSLYNGAVLAEICRAGVLAVPKGQSEAAYAIGMRKTQTMNLILLPQAVRIMIPAIISQCVVALKDTSLILIVVPVGLTKIPKQLPQEFQNVVPTVIVITALYVITNLILTWIANYLQKKLVGEKKVLQVATTTMPTGATTL